MLLIEQPVISLSLDIVVEYQPSLLDTSGVQLSQEHLYLAEHLADRTHAHWVRSLLDLGWQWGPQVDAASRTHPYLRPFRDLPEALQQERLQVYLDNLKLALALGYRVTTAPAAGAAREAAVAADSGTTAPAPMGAIASRLAPLLALRRDLLNVQPRTADLYCTLGDTLLQVGEPLLAYDVLNEGLKHWPTHLRLQQLLALALARSGSPQVANQMLLKLVAAGQRDEQTLGLLARTDKDLWRQAHDPHLKQQHLHLAATRYQEAHALSNSLWTGINAATMALIRGARETAHQLAQEVLTQGQQQLERAAAEGKDIYWILATLGEAELILEHWETAEHYYTQAASVGRTRFGDLCSSYGNAALLMEYYGLGCEKLLQWFQLPRVVVFCGHRIDGPNRAQPRFPDHLEESVYNAIADRLQAMRGQVGYASASCGSDILFLEAMLAQGGECNIVLPYNRDRFMADSVAVAGEGWVERFNRVLGRAREVVIASEDNKPPDNAISYEYSNRLLHGLAQIRARQLHTELIPLTVWNAQPGDGPGGTASTVSYWRQWSPRVEVIDMAALLERSGVSTAVSAATAPAATHSAWLPKPKSQREIRALLFADVVHYTQLSDEQLFAFMQRFLAAVADLTAQPGCRPLMCNTWGDALYYVFATVREAGCFALELSELMAKTSWDQAGLPTGLNVRIALHAGPVFRNHDPVTGQINYIGTHVNHAARIEPVTPPGKVYASQAFAAIAASEGIHDFACDYVGQMPWAKQYGTFPTFHVHRTL